MPLQAQTRCLTLSRRAYAEEKTMIEKKYGQIAETSKEARAIGSAYSQEGANYLRFAVVDWKHPLAMKGETGAQMRRDYMDSQSHEVQEMYRECRTIGIPWIEIQFTSHDFHRLPLQGYFL